jgi:hypothetical protein
MLRLARKRIDGIQAEMRTQLFLGIASSIAIQGVRHDRISVGAKEQIEINTGGAHTSFAMSRSLNFWILPVEVFGNSANTT